MLWKYPALFFFPLFRENEPTPAPMLCFQKVNEVTSWEAPEEARQDMVESSLCNI